MKNKKNNQPLTPEQQEIMKIFEDSQKLYLAILAQLNVDHNDEVYCGLILGMIERQSKDHLIMSIWKNMDDAQAKHFREYLNQMSVIAPWTSNDDLLIEFALMYPALMEKVYDSLMKFFEEFVKKFNEINEG